MEEGLDSEDHEPDSVFHDPENGKDLANQLKAEVEDGTPLDSYESEHYDEDEYDLDDFIDNDEDDYDSSFARRKRRKKRHKGPDDKSSALTELGAHLARAPYLVRSNHKIEVDAIRHHPNLPSG